MKSGRIYLRQALSAAALILLVVSILTLLASKTVLSQTTGTLTLIPTEGPPGTAVNVNGQGFTLGSTVTIKFNGVTVATTQAYSFAHLIYAKITVPSVEYGTYEIAASNNLGESATASFTVAASTPLPTETPPPEEGTPTNPPSYYTPIPTQRPGTQSAEFWSPLVIAVIGVVVAAAVIVPVALVLRSRSSRRETLLGKEPTPYRSEPYAQTNQPTPPYSPPTSRYSPPSSRYSSSSTRYSPSSSPYNPSSTYRPSTYSQYSTRSAVTNRYSQPSSSVQQPTFGKTCPHCKRVVKQDYNICPYCNKRMR